jgi:heme exporter protein C
VEDLPVDSAWHGKAAGLTAACLVLASLLLVFLVAPTEATMGDVQRLLYLHVSAAWCGLVACLVMGFCALMLLVRRRLEWDFWSQAAGEVGWMCATLTLISGSAWAHEAWGVWWTWEPRLTSSFLLWVIYAGIFLVRSSVEEASRRARIAGILAVVGVLDVPLVLVATRLFRGVHPVSPEMDPRMRLVLLCSVVSFTLLAAFLVSRRRIHLELAERVAQIEAAIVPVRVEARTPQLPSKV